MLPYTGKLSLYVLRAKDLRDVQLIGKQDPYCRVQIQNVSRKTGVARDGDRFPVWDANYAMTWDLRTVENPTVSIKLMNENTMSDTQIGEVEFPLAVLLSNREEWFPIFISSKKHKRSAGFVLIRTIFNGTGGHSEEKDSRWGVISARYGIGKCDIDVLPAVNALVRESKLSISGGTELNKFFGVDPMPNRLDKELELKYLKDGKKVTIVLNNRIPDDGVEVDFDDYGRKMQEQDEAIRAEREARAKEEKQRLEALKKEADERAREEVKAREELERQHASEAKARAEAEAKVKALESAADSKEKALEAAKARSTMLAEQLQKADAKLKKLEVETAQQKNRIVELQNELDEERERSKRQRRRFQEVQRNSGFTGGVAKMFKSIKSGFGALFGRR